MLCWWLLTTHGPQVMFSTMTAKYGVAFAHSLPSHLLSRVMGAVIMGMAPVGTYN
jgi:hypothetical protein